MVVPFKELSGYLKSCFRSTEAMLVSSTFQSDSCYTLVEQGPAPPRAASTMGRYMKQKCHVTETSCIVYVAIVQLE